MRKDWIVLGLCLFILQCSHGTPHKDVTAAVQAPAASHDLTKEEAQSRAARLSQITYDLALNITETSPEFTGVSTLHFDLNDAAKPLRIDFYNGKVLKLTINGADTTAYHYAGSYIEIPPGTLKEGHNDVAVSYSHSFSTSGTGLYRFVDPEDHLIYTYTNFEPYDANRFFPCFDQPDLKARYTIQAQVPASWQMISSTREEKIQDLGHGRKLWIFPQSNLMSTYLISLHGGPYKVWTSQAGSIPLRLFARQSLAKYVVSSDWFGPTRAGLKFYSNYFAYPYPFKKYDQVLVPDFNAGAMENVAAVTFSERYIRRGHATDEDRERIASVLLHEMAHMWFGDLVTMKWWNDLWLNESFATFMSAKSMAMATPFKKSWQSFFLNDKQWAYHTDQLVTTHPIEATVPDTDQAFANFDGITYGKGASVLKQLSFYLGEKNFRRGVRNYFKKYASKNAELQDFIGSLAQAAHKDLHDWTHQWLQTAGVNDLDVDLQCQDGKISHLTLTQRGPDNWPTLRDHKTQVALFKKSADGKIVMDRSFPVIYGSTPVDVHKAEGRACPALVYPNFGDQDYVKVHLDAASITTARTSLAQVSDSMDRSMIWAAMWDMVRDQQYSVKDYADLVLAQFPGEREAKIINEVVGTINGGRYFMPNILLYLPRATVQDKIARAAYVSKFENLTWDHFTKEKDSNLQKFWFDAFCRLAQTPAAQDRLLGLLEGKINVPGFEFDQDRRWNAIVQINTFNPLLGQTLTEREKSRDTSNAGQLMVIASEAARPVIEVKQHWFDLITGPSTMPFNQVRYAMWNLFPQSQEDIHEQFKSKFFQALPRMIQTKSENFQETFSESLAPNTCTKESAEEINKILEAKPTFTPIVLKNLKIAWQEDQRCVKIRGFAAANSGAGAGTAGATSH